MSHRSAAPLLAGWLLLLALCAVSVCEEPEARQLVLTNGTRIDVAGAELRGNQVIVTLPNGSLMSYMAEDVDLEASGLVSVEPGESASSAVARPAALSDARAEAGEAKLKITDDDVEHVDPEADEAEGAEAEVKGVAEFDKSGPVQVTSARYWLAGEELTVSGQIKNTGEEAFGAIAVKAVATGATRTEVGRGATEVRGPLRPGATSRFRMSFAVSSEPIGVRVTVGGNGGDPSAPEPAASPRPRERPTMPKSHRPGS